MNSIPVNERSLADKEVFAAFDLSYPGLEKVEAAVHKEDYETAKKELVSYFHTRDHVSFLFDYRGTPLKSVDQSVDYRFFQADSGPGESFEKFILHAGKSIMDHIYVLPGGRAEPVDLGPHLETAPHFNYLADEGKRSRTPANMFTRGQWLEYFFVLYQNTGDHRVAEKFAELLLYFFNDYALVIEDTGVKANRFQYTEDRTVMSVGWLAVVYIELLYTEIAYAVDYEVTFSIIKHMWFTGLQFERFRDDTFRPHNHHLWERGLMPFILGTMFPEIPDFAAMKERGADQIRRHVKTDFNEHGGYNEYSIAYWSGAALREMLFRGVCLAKKNGGSLLDQDAMDRIDKTFQALAQIAPPAEHYPSIGDGRGALVNQVLALGETMADSEWCRQLLRYRTGLTAKAPSIPLYWSDDAVGFICGRTDYGPRATYFLEAAKVSCGGSGHNHMDMLSLNVTIRGEEFIGEPYTGTLYPRVRMGSRQRGYLYNMTSHNTVLAYGKPMADDEMYAKQWCVLRPDCPVHAFVTWPEGMYAEASHSGYSYCRHGRKILFADNGNMAVRDEIRPGCRAEGSHVQRWHLMPGISCQRAGGNALLLEKSGIRVLCVWSGAGEIVLWKDEEVLCPEMYPSKESLGYNIDVKFGEKRTGDVEELTASVDMAIIDVTDREGYDIGEVIRMLEKAGTDMEREETLKILKNI